MADRGLHAYVVPSARAGQRSDPAARRDALSGLMTGGFLLAIIATILAIVMAAPQYAEPPADVAPAVVQDREAAAVASAAPQEPEVERMSSRPPDRLKGYRWPVRGGDVDTYYQVHPAGRSEIDGERVHDGLLITWFDGAPVKAAHAGTVLAAGQDWIEQAGYVGAVDRVIETFERRARKAAREMGAARARFPLGVVIDDGNGYRSVYTEIRDLQVKVGDAVKAGQTVGLMSRAEGRQMMRYRLVRMDGPPMKVHESDRRLGYPDYARERVDPLAVLSLETKRMPRLRGKLPADPPRLSDY